MIIIYGNIRNEKVEKALDIAINYELQFEYRNVDMFLEYLDEVNELLPGVDSYPQIFWHGKHIGGYEDFVNEIENTRNYGDGKI